MLVLENRCVDCGLPCMGKSCSNRNVTVYYCDECGDELWNVYEVDDEHLCECCLCERFIKR